MKHRNIRHDIGPSTGPQAIWETTKVLGGRRCPKRSEHIDITHVNVLYVTVAKEN